MMPTFSMEKAYTEVLGRLARYQNMNPKLAFNLVTDKHFMFAVSLETDATIVEEKIENKFIDIANQLQLQKETLEKGVENKNGTIEKLEARIATIEKKVEETETKYKKQNIELEKSFEQIRDLENSLETEETKKTAAEKEFKDIKETFNGFKAKTYRWIIFAFPLVLASLFLWFHQRLLDWHWLDTHNNKTFIEIAMQLLLVFILLNIPLKQHWKVWLGIVVPIILAILGFARL
jgi:hypothetical protein